MSDQPKLPPVKHTRLEGLVMLAAKTLDWARLKNVAAKTCNEYTSSAPDLKLDQEAFLRFTAVKLLLSLTTTEALDLLFENKAVAVFVFEDERSRPEGIEDARSWFQAYEDNAECRQLISSEISRQLERQGIRIQNRLDVL